MFCIPQSAYALKWYRYVISDGAATIVEYKSTDEDFVIPASIGEYPVTAIGDYALERCYAVTITLPDSVTTVGKGAFRYCDELTEVRLSGTVTAVAADAFDFCGALTDISVSGDNPAFSDVDGILFNKAKTELIRYTEGRSGTAYTVPDSVTAIGESAFYRCRRLVRVSAPKGLKRIEENAFRACSKLADIAMPDALEEIGGFAFYACKSLTSVTVPRGVTEIGSGAFSFCSLTDISVADENQFFSDLNGSLFDKTQKKLVQYAVGKTESAYAIPAGVTVIGDRAFVGCASLTEISIPSSVTSIGRYAFLECVNLADIEIPSGVTVIEDGVFCGCEALAETTIPNNAVSIGAEAFGFCTGLTVIALPGKVEAVGERAFSGCSALERITISDSVKSIGVGAFDYCDALIDISVSEGNPSYKSVSGNLFNKSGTELVNYAPGKSDTSYTLPTGVESIGYRAFSHCTSLERVVIPEGVTSIGGFAFCFSGLTEAALPYSVTSIGDSPFAACSSLTALNVALKLQAAGSGMEFERQNNIYLSLGAYKALFYSGRGRL